MSAHCCGHKPDPEARPRDAGYRRVLWIALGINAVMFVVEIVAGLAAGSVSLQADALDFLADAGNYGISLFVAGMALRNRARAALLKGASMGLFGAWVTGATVWHVESGTIPHFEAMGAVAVLALLANAAVLGLLWAYRRGDSNMRSVWLCSRNDVIGNVAVMLAALGVWGSGTGWPDMIVAAVMAFLALQGAAAIIRQAMVELHKSQPTHAPAE